jgi:phosphinothricin acetyltransferase
MACVASFEHRVARREDLRPIVDIYNSTVPSRLVTADTEPVSIESRLRWFEEHSADFRPLWVVEVDGRIAGWLSFSSFYGRPAYSKTAEISVYVHESHRKRGLGSYFLTQALAQAPSLGIETLLGFIFGHNVPSLALFERFGFERWGLLPRVATLDGVERDVAIVGRRV